SARRTRGWCPRPGPRPAAPRARRSAHSLAWRIPRTASGAQRSGRPRCRRAPSGGQMIALCKSCPLPLPSRLPPPPVLSRHLSQQTLGPAGGFVMLKRWFVAPFIVGVIAASVGSLGLDVARAQAPVKIGVIEPLSGPVAASGNYIRMGAEIARDWLNAKGGVIGRKVELVIEDNKSDPKEAASAGEKLIVRDKGPAIMGAWGSSMTLAAMPKLEEYGVPMVVETSSAASITKRGNPWIFRISPPSEMEAVGLEPYVDKLAIKKADFLA